MNHPPRTAYGRGARPLTRSGGPPSSPTCRRTVCGERSVLPAQLLDAAAAFAGGADAGTDDVQRCLRCTLQEHTVGDHFGFVRELHGIDTGSVWTHWTRGNPPAAVVVFPDCEATGPAPEREPCCEFHDHPGGHTFELADPWRPLATALPLAARAADRNLLADMRSSHVSSTRPSRPGTGPAPDTSPGEQPVDTGPSAAPTATRRTWTFTTTTGYSATGYLPPWARDDPSETGLSMDQLALRLDDLSHQSSFPGQPLRVWTSLYPDDDGSQEYEEESFRGMITCNVYDEDPMLRVPVVNIEVLPEYTMEALTPDDLADLAAKLRAQADRIDNKVRPALIEARADWDEHRESN